MRLALSILSLLLLGAVPRLASAQQAPAQPVVDLATVDVGVEADAPRRSAFGRVMDLMIATLVEQHDGQAPARAVPTASLALEAAPDARRDGRRPSGRAKAAKIDIALGERFALPPADAVSRVDVPE